MMRALLIPALAVLATNCATPKVAEQNIQAAAAATDFGDSSSETLTVKAWKALAEKKYPELFAYTSRCVELYADEAKRMNGEMTDYEPSATAAQKWALNDVGTCLFIKGEAYVNLERYPEAVKAYRAVVDDYKYAQCWDPKGWYWRPAEVAEKKAEAYAYRE